MGKRKDKDNPKEEHIPHTSNPVENRQVAGDEELEIDITETDFPLEDFSNPAAAGAFEQDQEQEAPGGRPPPQVRILQEDQSTPLPEPGETGSQPAPFDPSQTHYWQALVAEYESEIAAIGEVPEAAHLYYESGKIFEEKLAQPHNAWGYYKKAFQLQPGLLPNIRAARRLASQMGNWKTAVMVLDSEIHATVDPYRRASLIQQRGRMLEEKLDRSDEARSMYEKAAALAPSSPELIKQLEKVYISYGDWKKAIEVRERLASLVEDPIVAGQLLMSCAKIAQVYAKDSATAEKMYQRVLDMDANNFEACQALKLIYETEGNYERMLDVLVGQARNESDPSAGAWMYYQAARLYRDQVGDEERALECLKKAVQLAPDNHMVLAEMANIYEGFMRWQDLVAVYQKQIEHITDRQELVSLYFKLGNIWEERLFDEDKAIEHYHNVIELNPSYLPALQSLGKLFYRKGQWENLVRMYEIELQTTSDPKARTTRLYKLAEILEERLERDEEAITKLEECIAQSPGFLPALKSLGRLYIKYNRWESLINMYEKELEWCQDVEQSIFILDKVGNIWEEKLGDIDKAIRTYKRLLELSPNHLPAIRTLGKLFSKADRWEDMIKINHLESQLVNDMRQTVSLLHRNGEIYEEKLNDKETAILTYKEVLAMAPNYLPALQSLGRIYFVKGCWEELIDMYRQEIEVTTNLDQKVALLYKIGELYEEKLVQEDKAIETYREVLTLQEADFPAIKALIRIYTNQRDWSGLIEIYTKQAQYLEDPGQRALTLFQSAEIWCNNLNQHDKAIDVLHNILRFSPEHMPSIEFLERLYLQTQNWSDLLLLYDREIKRVHDETEQISLMSRMAEVYAGRLNDLARAAECHEKILLMQPNNLASLEVLERIYLSRRDYAAVLRVYEACANVTADAKLQLALQSQIADLKENRVQPPQNAGLNQLKILSLDPFNSQAVRSLEMLYQKYGTWSGLHRLYERELEQVRNLDEAVDLCLRVADLAQTHLGEPEVGEHYYREVLRLKPDHLPAIKALKKICQDKGDHQQMIAFLEQEGRITRDPDQAVSILLQASDVYMESFHDQSKAIACLQSILDKNPLHAKAFERLERLLAQSDEQQLAALYRKRIATTQDEAGLVTNCLKLGELLRKDTGQYPEAVECFQKILKLQPSNLPAQAAMAQLTFELEDWDASIRYNVQIQQEKPDKKILAETHIRLGTIYHEKKPDLDLAVMHLGRALENDAGNRLVQSRLRDIYIEREQWPEAVEVLLDLVRTESDKKLKVHTLVTLGEIYEQGLQDLDKAGETYLEVLKLEPDRTSVIQKLGGIYERMERWQELVETYHSFTRLLPMGRETEGIALHIKLGDLYKRRLNNNEKAILEYKRVVAIQPDHVEARQALAELYGQSSVFYANAIDEHRKLLESEPYRLESYHELRRIFEEQRAYDKLLCVCSVLHVLRAGNPDEEFFFGENRSKVPERSTEKLSSDEIEALLVHPDEKGIIREILKVVVPALGKVFPANLERHGVGKGNRALAGDPLHTMSHAIANHLGIDTFDLYRSNQPTYLVEIENTNPPGLIVGEGLVKRTVVKEQRFALGKAVKLISDGSFLGISLGPQGLAKLIAACVIKLSPSCPLVEDVVEDLGDWSKKIMKALNRKQRKQLEDVIQSHSVALANPPDYQKYFNAVGHSANHMGLLVGGDLPQAVMHLLRENSELQNLRMTTTQEVVAGLSRHPAIGRLFNFAVSEEYFRLRVRLKLTISG